MKNRRQFLFFSSLFSLKLHAGRESRDQYNESYAGVQPYTSFGQFVLPLDPAFENGTLLPYMAPGPLAALGSADNKMMAYSYRACITNNAANQTPFPQPENYNADDFLLLLKYVTAVTAKSGAPLLGNMVGAYPYRSYPPNDKTDLCDSNNFAITSDAVNLNVDYISLNRTQRAIVAAQVKYYVQGYVYFLANDPRVPTATQESVQEYGLCRDEWPENGNWPPQMYIRCVRRWLIEYSHGDVFIHTCAYSFNFCREGVRLVGDTVLTQNDIVGGQCLNNSIGLASWSDDIHVVQRVAVLGPNNTGLQVLLHHRCDCSSVIQATQALNEGEMMAPYAGSGAFGMPYTLLLPKVEQASNLLVAVCNSLTHAAIGGVREEPEYMQLGAAAGMAAVLALQGRTSVQDVDVQALQRLIVSRGGIVQPVPCQP